jgi:hypothetical protein
MLTKEKKEKNSHIFRNMIADYALSLLIKNDIMISSVGYILSCYPTKPLPIWERFITIINSPHS